MCQAPALLLPTQFELSDGSTGQPGRWAPMGAFVTRPWADSASGSRNTFPIGGNVQVAPSGFDGPSLVNIRQAATERGTRLP